MNAKKPAIPHVPVRMSKPGTMPAGWMSWTRVRERRLPATTAGAVSGTNRVKAVATTAMPAAVSQAASNPSWREHQLADERADGQPQVDRQAADVDGFAAALLGRHVADGRQRGHEEERLGDAQHRAHHDERRQRTDGEVGEQCDDGQRAAEEQQRPPAEAVRRPARRPVA